MAQIHNEYGHGRFDKSFNFERKENYSESMTAKVTTDAVLTGEQTGKIKDALDEFVEKLKRIVEEF